MQDDGADLLKNFFNTFNIPTARKTGIHIAGTLLFSSCPFEVEIFIEKLKRLNHQVPNDLINK
jgi:hypothetical protein